MALQIVHYGNPVLRKRGKPVAVFDQQLARLSLEMMAAMHAAAGIGLAAQQVGLELQFCVIDLRGVEIDFSWRLDGVSPPLDLIMPMALANPIVEVVPEPTTTLDEGCLSFPGIRGDVVRPDAIRVKFQDVTGVAHELTCNGLLSRCIQHEVDHLNGVLFIDRMSKRVLGALDDQLRTLKKETRKKR
jgi:peptide deformylase